MTWSKKRSTRSAALLKPDASATARSSSPTSRKRSGSELENPGWTLSKPGAIRILRLETGKGLLRQPDFVRDPIGPFAKCRAVYSVCKRSGNRFAARNRVRTKDWGQALILSGLVRLQNPGNRPVV